MLDWLADGDPQLPTVSVLVGRLVLAATLGFAVATIYRYTFGRRHSSPALPSTLVMLAVLVAFVMLAIGNSAARAFGLVGILSIVRFRSVVEDTRDTAFVIFAVAVGMGVGAGAGILALIGVPVAGAVAALCAWQDSRRTAPVTGRLMVRMGLGHDAASLSGVLAKHFREVRLTAAGTAKGGGALEFVYAVTLIDPTGFATAVAELNRQDGVQAAELKSD